MVEVAENLNANPQTISTIEHHISPLNAIDICPDQTIWGHIAEPVTGTKFCLAPLYSNLCASHRGYSAQAFAHCLRGIKLRHTTSHTIEEILTTSARKGLAQISHKVDFRHSHRTPRKMRSLSQLLINTLAVVTHHIAHIGLIFESALNLK